MRKTRFIDTEKLLREATKAHIYNATVEAADNNLTKEIVELQAAQKTNDNQDKAEKLKQAQELLSEQAIQLMLAKLASHRVSETPEEKEADQQEAIKHCTKAEEAKRARVKIYKELLR